MSSQKTKITGAKLTAEDAEKIEIIKLMLGTENTSEAIRWCIKAAWKEHEDDIMRIANQRKLLEEMLGGIEL